MAGALHRLNCVYDIVNVCNLWISYCVTYVLFVYNKKKVGRRPKLDRSILDVDSQCKKIK